MEENIIWIDEDCPPAMTPKKVSRGFIPRGLPVPEAYRIYYNPTFGVGKTCLLKGSGILFADEMTFSRKRSDECARELGIYARDLNLTTLSMVPRWRRKKLSEILRYL